MWDFVIKLIKLVSYYILSTGFFRENTRQGLAWKHFQKWGPGYRHENNNFVSDMFDKFWLNLKNFQFVPVFTVKFDLTRNSLGFIFSLELNLYFSMWLDWLGLAQHLVRNRRSQTSKWNISLSLYHLHPLPPPSRYSSPNISGRDLLPVLTENCSHLMGERQFYIFILHVSPEFLALLKSIWWHGDTEPWSSWHGMGYQII